MPVRVVGINHIAFEVADLEQALAWYERWFEVTLRGSRGPQMAFIDLGDQFIALTQADADGPHVDRTRHHGIVVDDKEALRAELLQAGVDVAPAGSHLRIHDPSGNQLEIVDYREVQFSKSEAVLRGMGLDGLRKSDAARRELADKGLLG